jgi:murein DD-endopeptidase MepM/ murein hydrolase activator NlpD
MLGGNKGNFGFIILVSYGYNLKILFIGASVKSVILWTLLISSLFGAVSVESEWKEGEVFSTYLESHGISQNLIQNIEDTDKQFLSEIQSGVKIFELYDKNGDLLQSLIPIGEEMQIQISKDELNDEYLFDIIPIIYGVREHEVVIPITTNPNQDIVNSIHHTRLATTIDHLFKGRVDCRKLQHGDTLAMIYKQKQRLGKPFLDPEVKIAMIETNHKKKFVFVDEDGEGHSDTVKEVEYITKGKKRVREEVSGKGSGKFGMPIRNVRISSRFTYKRWHPILKRYRPHLGVDFAAKRGTPLLAVAPGKVVFSGWKGGYGRVVKVKHAGGYVSLYAHQSRIRAKQGSYVKKGQVIGYVGSSGRSTGPHLHFGMYRSNRAINPLKVIHKRYNKRSRMVTKIIDIINKKRVVIKGAKENKERLLKILDNPPELFSWEHTKNNFMLVNDKENIGHKG